MPHKCVLPNKVSGQHAMSVEPGWERPRLLGPGTVTCHRMSFKKKPTQLKMFSDFFMFFLLERKSFENAEVCTLDTAFEHIFQHKENHQVLRFCSFNGLNSKCRALQVVPESKVSGGLSDPGVKLFFVPDRRYCLLRSPLCFGSCCCHPCVEPRLRPVQTVLDRGRLYLSKAQSQRVPKTMKGRLQKEGSVVRGTRSF